MADSEATNVPTTPPFLFHRLATASPSGRPGLSVAEAHTTTTTTPTELQSEAARHKSQVAMIFMASSNYQVRLDKDEDSLTDGSTIS